MAMLDMLMTYSYLASLDHGISKSPAHCSNPITLGLSTQFKALANAHDMLYEKVLTRHESPDMNLLT